MGVVKDGEVAMRGAWEMARDSPGRSRTGTPLLSEGTRNGQDRHMCVSMRSLVGAILTIATYRRFGLNSFCSWSDRVYVHVRP